MTPPPPRTRDSDPQPLLAHDDQLRNPYFEGSWSDMPRGRWERGYSANWGRGGTGGKSQTTRAFGSRGRTCFKEFLFSS